MSYFRSNSYILVVVLELLKGDKGEYVHEDDTQEGRDHDLVEVESEGFDDIPHYIVPLNDIQQ